MKQLGNVSSRKNAHASAVALRSRCNIFIYVYELILSGRECRWKMNGMSNNNSAAKRFFQISKIPEKVFTYSSKLS
jgi:hypothetical protein